MEWECKRFKYAKQLSIMTQKTSKYLELTKPKVTFLNLLVGVTCFVVAVFPTVDWLKLAVFAVIGYLAAGGCGVINSVYDQDIDKLMTRTSEKSNSIWTCSV